MYSVVFVRIPIVPQKLCHELRAVYAAHFGRWLRLRPLPSHHDDLSIFPSDNPDHWPCHRCNFAISEGQRGVYKLSIILKFWMMIDYDCLKGIKTRYSFGVLGKLVYLQVDMQCLLLVGGQTGTDLAAMNSPLAVPGHARSFNNQPTTSQPPSRPSNAETNRNTQTNHRVATFSSTCNPSWLLPLSIVATTLQTLPLVNVVMSIRCWIKNPLDHLEFDDFTRLHPDTCALGPT